MSKENPKVEAAIPMIAAPMSPFRLVFRDKDDQWEPTWNEVHSRTYDYIKLNRLSVILDVGLPENAHLCVGFDGTMFLPAMPDYRNRDKAVQVFNEILGRMLLGGVYVEAISPADVSQGLLYPCGYTQIHSNLSPATAFRQAIRTQYLGTLELPLLESPPSIFRKELYDAHKDGFEISSKIPNLSLSILLRGITYFINHEWAEALINVWNCNEQVISHIWNTKIIGQPTKNIKIAGREDFLKDFRSWPVSGQCELLFQRKLIDVETYRRLNSARKARNDFVHKSILPTKAGAQSAIEALFRLISRTISDFKKTASLSNLLKVYQSHDRLAIDEDRRNKKIGKVTAWLPIPPVPGMTNWGDRPFETFDDINFKLPES